MLPHPIHPRPVNHPVKQLEMVVGGVKGQEGNRGEEPPTEGINPFPSTAAGAAADWPVTFAHSGLLESRPFHIRLSDLMAFCAN